METVSIKFQILFSGKNKKNITNLSCVELKAPYSSEIDILLSKKG